MKDGENRLSFFLYYSMDFEKQVNDRVDEYVSKYIGTDFVFRPFQKEAIVNIILNILGHRHHNYIVEAPTGSGKSLINIISAGVLAEYYHLTSYILVSDLYLWEQYEGFLKKYPLLNIGALKGQAGNYMCERNNEDIRHADCRISGYSWANMVQDGFSQSRGFDCAKCCEYIKARRKAMKADVCIMTYQLFMLIMNGPNVKDGKDSYAFSRHDVIFCDECHNIPSIVQTQYAPAVRDSDAEKLKEIFNRYYNYKYNLFSDEGDSLIDNFMYKDVVEMGNDLDDIWKVFSNEESRHDEINNALIEYFNIISELKPFGQDIKSDMAEMRKNGQAIGKDELRMYKLAVWLDNICNTFDDFNMAIKNTGTEYLLTDISTVENEDHEKKTSVSFRCTKEDWLVYRYLLTNAKYKVFLSATIGGEAAYAENMGFRFDVDPDKTEEMNKPYTAKIPSTFDFSQSPVHFLNKFKMSYRDKDVSFEYLKNVIYSICTTKFKDAKGIIQTGSYFFAQKLYENAPYAVKRRMLLYNGSKEKNMMISLHKDSANTILVGPTLNTGVDLPGDDCRFIIILKVPYPSMGDPLVKEKIRLFPLWYNSATSNEIIQGIGRGVRYDGDWCVTYILDACFANLYMCTKEQYPVELQKRINFI